MAVRYPFHSLEDFLVSNLLTVDGDPDDGWGAPFPVKGREINATVLFADIAGFSSRTAHLDPTETLAFVNNFFSWITAQALRGRPGIVDKYIGDEVMVVFSEEFGSEDPFVDAVQTARWMGQNDAHAFMPHVGIASGVVIVGYVGTPLKYSCSVFGAPVALAARCAAIRPPGEGPISSYMTFPASEWKDRDFAEVITAQRVRESDGSHSQVPHGWELSDVRSVAIKNLPDLEVRQILNKAAWLPSQSAQDRARETVDVIRAAGRRWANPRVDYVGLYDQLGRQLPEAKSAPPSAG